MTTYEETIQYDTKVSAAQKLAAVLGRLQIKDRGSSIVAISLQNKKREMIKSFGNFLVRLSIKQLEAGFDALKSGLYVYKKHFESLKARSMVKYLDGY